MQARFQFRSNLIVRALALASAATVLPAGAAIDTSGNFGTVNPNGSFADGVFIGVSALGQFTVNEGSQLDVARLVLGATASGDGTLTVTGAGSRTFVTFANGSNLDLGGLGRGSISVLDGASFVYGTNGNACQLNCRIFISNGAGSTGNLLVSGAGSSLSTAGSITAGNASMFTPAADGTTYGAPGGASTGNVQVTAGGSVNSSFLSIANPGGGTARTGNESSRGSVVVDGMNSVWNLVRNAAQTGSRGLLNIALGQNSNGSLLVSNGGRVTLDGSTAAGEFSGINVASLAASSTATNVMGSLTVQGAGSRINFTGGRGTMNAGQGAGTTGSITIQDGGQIGGTGVETGLTYVSIGRGGATASLAVDGVGSLLRLNGKNSSTNTSTTSIADGGAFLNIGRAEGGLAGNGTATISNGGRVAIDTLGVQLTNVNGQTGMFVGVGAGSAGVLNVTGSGSRLDITADSGMTPYVGIGRDGASGTLNISAGGRVEVTSTHVSVPNPTGTGYLPGDGLFFDIGRRGSGADNNASTGVANVSGAGSALVIGGAADGFVTVGRGNGAAGTLNITNGGLVQSKVMLIGQDAGANGVVNVNGGRIVIDGLLNGGPSAGGAGGIGVGRGGGGTGTLNVAGGSVITIGSTVAGASLSAGASGNAPGGTGFINISGGSTLSVSGPNALVSIGRQSTATAAGVGQLTLSGAGSSVSAVGTNARVLIGGMANTAGTVIVGSGSSLSASGSIGNAFDSGGQTVGTGVLVVDGTVNTPTLTNGSNGYLGGSGVINGNVVNHGLMNPGNSPGRLTINGALDNRNGTIVLEVQSLGNSLFAMDEIVLGDPAQALLEGGVIQFQFLGDTNPLAFQAAGLFDIADFFKEVDANGDVVGLGGARLGLFDNVRFSAASARFGITNFRFSAANGANFGVVAAVPAPATGALVLLALALMGVKSRTRRQR